MMPEGWIRTTIAGVSSVPVSYGVVQTGDPVEGGVPCVRVVDIASRDLKRDSMITTSHEISASYSRTVLKAGDLMIALRGIIGQTAQATRELEGCNLTRGIARISPKAGTVTSDFLLQSLNGPEFKSLINRQANGSALQEISIATLRKAPVLLPPISEQRRIAETLQTWDRAIETVEALIANARAQKQALMQQLLPQGSTQPKKRLPGFSGEWREVRLGNLVKEVNRDVDWDDDATYKLISVRRRSEGIFHRESLLGHEILTKAMKVALAGDFLISKMQIVHGASALVKTNFDGFNISGSYIALMPKDQAKLDIEYFDWYSRTPYFYKLAYISSYGVHIEKMTFNLKSFLKQTILVPPSKAEQSAIVEQLNSAEALIGVYQQQAGALRQEKAALMQQLLTGKRRVKLPESEVA